jgi:hypothetical protein
VIEDAMKRSNVDETHFVRALDLDRTNDGAPKDVCSARVATREAILNLPENQAEKIMRDMED